MYYAIGPSLEDLPTSLVNGESLRVTDISTNLAAAYRTTTTACALTSSSQEMDFFIGN